MRCKYCGREVTEAMAYEIYEPSLDSDWNYIEYVCLECHSQPVEE